MLKATRITETMEELSFEQALKELETIAAKLESGDVALDTSLQLFERGNQLKQYCEDILKNAQMKVDKIVQMKDGSVSLEPFDTVL